MKLKDLLGVIACDQEIILNTRKDNAKTGVYFYHTPFGVPFEHLGEEVSLVRTNEIDGRLVVWVEEL